MTTELKQPTTLAEVLNRIEGAALPATRRRDLLSAVRRICTLARVSPAAVQTEPGGLRHLLAGILPAKHGLTPKSWANLRSAFAAALVLAGVIEAVPRGTARRDASWRPLVARLTEKRLANGLATFANWCAVQGIAPEHVADETVDQFHLWLEARTLHPKPQDAVRRTPALWNEARATVPGWPQIPLRRRSFRKLRQHFDWPEFLASLVAEVDAYIELRRKADVFGLDGESPGTARRMGNDPDGGKGRDGDKTQGQGENGDMPKVPVPPRPLAESTLRQQREHLRIAASLIARQRGGPDQIRGLAELVRVDSFTAVLRHYYERAERKPNAFVISMAKTLIDVARYQMRVSSQELKELRRQMAKLPRVPRALTEKNKALIAELESERVRSRLYCLPDELLGEVSRKLDDPRLPFAAAQVAIAVDILLVAPLRAQNLIRLIWRKHFSEPNGRRGALVLRIPKNETKTKERDLVFELPRDVAKRLRWYRMTILPRLGADPDGALFVVEGGKPKAQETLAQQVCEALAARVGVRMTLHQFRHVAAVFYRDEHPEDFETIRQLLGHASLKSTLIYAGNDGRGSSRAFNNFIILKRERFRLAGKRLRKPRKR